MSAVKSHHKAHPWLHLDTATRQQRIRRFYASYDTQTAREFLELVRAPHGYGVYASIGPNYEYAIFGRDSIEVAEDILASHKPLTRDIILVLAKLQGVGFNMASEEELGKIHHEYRSLYFNDETVTDAARMALEKLGPLWGGSKEEMLYYGSFDATPMFIRLVHNYCQQYGAEILDEPITGRDGGKRTLREHVRLAATWLTGKITGSPWRLLEYRRINPLGLFNQAWKDSSFAYLHKDGTVANADDGLAAIEMQGYAHDALRAAADIVAVNEQEANAWRHLASVVRDNALQRLWMPGKRYFAMGLDRHDSGASRHIETLSANVGYLLESDMLALMPHHQAWPYIEGIVRCLCSGEFMTPAGLRLRARSQSHLVSFADYHGSLVTWPTATRKIAKGLRKHGFYELAGLLEDSVLHAVARAGEFYEFFLVDTNKRVKYHYRDENPDEPTFHEFGAANVPEPGQAWTISAVLNIVAARHAREPLQPVSDAVRKLETSLLAQPHVQELRKMLAASSRSIPAELDTVYS